MKQYETPEKALYADRPDELRLEALRLEIEKIEKRITAKPTSKRLKAEHQRKLQELEELTIKLAGISSGKIETR